MLMVLPIVAYLMLLNMQSILMLFVLVWQILTFKEVSWQMIRIEADAIQSSEHEVLSAPIRLITNQSRIRVTLKRRVSAHRHTHTLQFRSSVLNTKITLQQ